MKKTLKGFIAGVLLTAITLFCVPAFAEDIYQSITVVFNAVKIVVNGEAANVQNIVYNGSTYIKVRDVANVYGKEVEWDTMTRTAYIDEKGSLKLQKPGFADLEAYYPSYSYLALGFSEEMKALSDASQISLVSSSGEKVAISSAVPGNTEKNALCFIFNDYLKLSENYTLHIPKGTLQSISGKKYLRDIDVSFKTSDTVLKVICPFESKVKTITVTNGIDTFTSVEDECTLTAANIKGGNYKVVCKNADGKEFTQNITVEGGIMNKVTLTPVFK